MEETIRNGRPTQGEAPLAGRRALVLGATGGIGLRLARRLAAEGALVVVHGRDGAKARAVAETLPGAEWTAARLDGSVLPSALLDEAARSDVLAPCWGPFLREPLARTSPEDWYRLAACDLALPGALVSRAAPAMAERGYGRILLFGGTRTDAIRGYRSNAAYAAAKTGLGVLAKSVAAEFGARGVAAAVLCPGFVDTEYLSADDRAALRATSPGGRLLDPSEFADFAVEFLLRGLPVANGAVLSADGGLHMP